MKTWHDFLSPDFFFVLQAKEEEGAVLVEGKEVRAKQEPPGGVRSAELIKSKTKSSTWFIETFENRSPDGIQSDAKCDVCKFIP